MMTELERALRHEIVGTMREMDARSLNRGTAGNISVRHGDSLLITPSGIAAASLTPESIVRMDLQGRYAGDFKPSSEWQMHAGILEHRPDVNAVVHCHSRFATTLACAGKPIPPVHYMTTMSGAGVVPVAPYAAFGSKELADAILETLDGRFACLMANHGQIAVSADLDSAFAIADEMEVQASYYYGTLAIGGPKLLSEVEIEDVLRRFEKYGQSDRS